MFMDQGGMQQRGISRQAPNFFFSSSHSPLIQPDVSPAVRRGGSAEPAGGKMLAFRLEQLLHDPLRVAEIVDERVAGQGAVENPPVTGDRGFHGPSITVNTACSSGGDAIMTAAMLLNFGEADAILVVGGESILSPVLISSLAAAKALSRRNDDPKAASRPFDRDRDGFVIGEGGGALVIETERHAKARGVTSYATLAGFANTQDGYHITAPDPHGAGAAKCMHLALERAGLAPSDIGYLNAHGTSTPMGDKGLIQKYVDRNFDPKTYLWPIPNEDVMISNGVLEQNDGY